jgi:hypothetical protein
MEKIMRIWTFGCSFTQFPWPTWADILIKEVEEKKHKGENWGRCGAGNLYIASKIWECNARNKFGPNDWVFVQWSGFTREDRYTGSGWSTPGNIFSQNVYNDKFVNDWANPKFYALRDCTLITSTRLALAQLGVNQLHWSMMPLTQTNSCNPSHKVDDVTEVVNLYDVNLDLPSMMEYLDLLDHGEIAAKKRLKTKWRNGEPVLAEWHPTPWEHEKYINECITPRVPWLSNSGISDSTKNFVNQWRERLTNETPPIILDNIGWITPRYGY